MATPSTTTLFQFPPTYSFPPFFTPQPNTSTRLSQLQKWSSLIQSYCRHHHIYRLSLIEAVESPLFHNAALRKRLGLSEARAVLDWMAKAEEEGGGGRRAKWIDGGSKTVAWVWWRRPEEWAGILADWVEATGQKNTVLTVYELIEGEGTASQGVFALSPLVQAVADLPRMARNGTGGHVQISQCPSQAWQGSGLWQ